VATKLSDKYLALTLEKTALRYMCGVLRTHIHDAEQASVLAKGLEMEQLKFRLSRRLRELRVQFKVFTSELETAVTSSAANIREDISLILQGEYSQRTLETLLAEKKDEIASGTKLDELEAARRVAKSLKKQLVKLQAKLHARLDSLKAQHMRELSTVVAGLSGHSHAGTWSHVSDKRHHHHHSCPQCAWRWTSRRIKMRSFLPSSLLCLRWEKSRSTRKN
jgi:hypothetical protein